MSKKKITVGITAYNCHKYLLNAIRSVIDQGSDLWIGILILDGGADRKTRKIFEQFKHPKFQKYAFNENKGPYGTRAKAIELSKTEWYYQLDGDDLLSLNAVRNIIEAIKNNPIAEFVYGNWEHFSTNQILIKTPIEDPEALCLGPLFVAVFPIKKSLFESLGGFYNGFFINADWDFWLSVYENDIIGAYINKKIDSVQVIYNYFKNVGSQELIHENLLPLDFEKNEKTKNSNIIYEPSKVEIVKSLVPKYFNTQIWQYLLESFASEQASRMLAMENATENSKDMINDLNLEFNKARQTAITTEMLEIVGGAEALSN